MAMPHRGDRKPISLLVPKSLREEIDRRAAQAGLIRGDYVTRILALEHGMPVPSYIPDGQPSDAQLRLPDAGARMSA